MSLSITITSYNLRILKDLFCVVFPMSFKCPSGYCSMNKPLDCYYYHGYSRHLKKSQFVFISFGRGEWIHILGCFQWLYNSVTTPSVWEISTPSRWLHNKYIVQTFQLVYILFSLFFFPPNNNFFKSGKSIYVGLCMYTSIELFLTDKCLS